ncbi:hypothetical protein J2I47_26070 [Fibrella sp. HMF5335]|uniref:SGNH hydrolase-type esterase domain-containing protein n=1 Tax=Fibrella rubiginis TaxID=2817060 RepID=A0A939GJ47_9BACT|nr:GDSL-type esterase/lipase family protein [Fibrella rubiginis]MBO0940039.1 hypothetical protein [Fibrella rubiginis]
MKTKAIALLLTLLSLSGWAQQAANYESEIAAFEAADKATPPPANPILFVGSSSIKLWPGLSEAFPGKTVLQRGFGGSEVADVIKFSPRIITPYKPRQVVLYAGDNDIAQSKKTAREVYNNVLTLFMLVRKNVPGATFTYVSIKPSPARRQQMAVQTEANALIKNYLSGQKNTSFVDVYTPMLNAAGQPRPELFTADSLHMNAAGYDVWKQAIAPALK